MFTDGVVLRAGEDDAEVGLAARQPLFVQKCIVPDIEAVEHSPSPGRMAQMIFVAPVDHRVIGSHDDIDMPCAKGRYQAKLHGILIEVQPDPAAPAAAVPTNPRALTLQVGERPGVRFAVPDTKEEWPELGYRLIPPGIDETTVPFTAPGPLLVLTRGEAVAIAVENHLATATTVHWHGIELESYYDGVPGWGNLGPQITPAIQPGETFIARFTPPRAGTFIYHTHLNDYEQLSTGLYGPIVVVEPGRPFDPATDKVFVLSRGGPDDDNDPLLVNGSATPPAQEWRQGVTYRLRFIGITPAPDVEVSMLRGETTLEWHPVAKDGAEFAARRAPVPALQVVSPGETYDFEFTPAETGVLTLRALLFGEIKTTMTIRVK